MAVENKKNSRDLELKKICFGSKIDRLASSQLFDSLI
jgi:hypothetical protein